MLGRFTRPDTIVPDPGDPQALNRYSYVNNNPVNYTDPSGHCVPEDCPGVPTVEYPGSGTGLSGGVYAQWLYNLILWIDRERAATGGVYNVTSNLIQETAAHELNSFLMDDPEILGEQFYQQLLMATPQLSAAAAGAGASVLMSGAGRVLSAVRAWNAGIPQYTFRGDTRQPAEIFETGFQSRGTHSDLLEYLEYNSASVYVGTSKSVKMAMGFAGQGGYVYSVRPRGNALDVNAVLGSRSPFPEELEVVVAGGIPSTDIMGARYVGPNRRFVGRFINNPGYSP